MPNGRLPAPHPSEPGLQAPPPLRSRSQLSSQPHPAPQTRPLLTSGGSDVISAPDSVGSQACPALCRAALLYHLHPHARPQRPGVQVEPALRHPPSCVRSYLEALRRLKQLAALNSFSTLPLEAWVGRYPASSPPPLLVRRLSRGLPLERPGASSEGGHGSWSQRRAELWDWPPLGPFSCPCSPSGATYPQCPNSDQLVGTCPVWILVVSLSLNPLPALI